MANYEGDRIGRLNLGNCGAGQRGVHVVRAMSTANLADLAAVSVTMDGVTLVRGDRVCLKDQSTGAQNGIYEMGDVVSGSGPLIRTPDFDGVNSPQPIGGSLISVSEGTANGNKIFQLTTNDPITIGTTALVIGVATSATISAASAVAAGTQSAADKRFEDNLHAAAGTALTDANATVHMTAGAWRVLPAATLSTGRTLTLGTTDAVAGDQMTITRLDLTANTYAIVNGGAGAGTLHTFPVSKAGFIKAQFDGTNWAVREVTPN